MRDRHRAHSGLLHQDTTARAQCLHGLPTSLLFFEVSDVNVLEANIHTASRVDLKSNYAVHDRVLGIDDLDGVEPRHDLIARHRHFQVIPVARLVGRPASGLRSTAKVWQDIIGTRLIIGCHLRIQSCPLLYRGGFARSTGFSRSPTGGMVNPRPCGSREYQ